MYDVGSELIVEVLHYLVVVVIHVLDDLVDVLIDHTQQGVHLAIMRHLQ